MAESEAIPRLIFLTAVESLVYLSSPVILRSIVIFKLEDFIGVSAKISCDLQSNDRRGHISAGLDEVDGLSRHSDSLCQFLLGDVPDGPFYLYRIFHTSSSLHCLRIFQIEMRNIIR